MAPDFEEKLRRELIQVAMIENARARKTWGNPNVFAGTEVARERGAKGGRPKEKLLRPLTPQSRMVNKMLQTGLNCVEIGDILSKPAEAVRVIKRRFELPRDEA